MSANPPHDDQRPLLDDLFFEERGRYPSEEELGLLVSHFPALAGPAAIDDTAALRALVRERFAGVAYSRGEATVTVTHAPGRTLGAWSPLRLSNGTLAIDTGPTLAEFRTALAPDMDVPTFNTFDFGVLGYARLAGDGDGDDANGPALCAQAFALRRGTVALTARFRSEGAGPARVIRARCTVQPLQHVAHACLLRLTLELEAGAAPVAEEDVVLRFATRPPLPYLDADYRANTLAAEGAADPVSLFEGCLKGPAGETLFVSSFALATDDAYIPFGAVARGADNAQFRGVNRPERGNAGHCDLGLTLHAGAPRTVSRLTTLLRSEEAGFDALRRLHLALALRDPAALHAEHLAAMQRLWEGCADLTPRDGEGGAAFDHLHRVFLASQYALVTGVGARDAPPPGAVATEGAPYGGLGRYGRDVVPKTPAAPPDLVDGDLFVVPFFVVAGHHARARALLSARATELRQAATAARLVGLEGALFTFRGQAALTGDDGYGGGALDPEGRADLLWRGPATAPYLFPSAVVALNAWHYFVVSKDYTWLTLEGLDILRQVMALFASAATREHLDDGEYAYHFRGARPLSGASGGGGEDDFFTNFAILTAVDAALQAYKVASLAAPPLWGDLLSRIHLPTAPPGALVPPPPAAPPATTALVGEDVAVHPYFLRPFLHPAAQARFAGPTGFLREGTLLLAHLRDHHGVTDPGSAEQAAAAVAGRHQLTQLAVAGMYGRLANAPVDANGRLPNPQRRAAAARCHQLLTLAVRRASPWGVPPSPAAAAMLCGLLYHVCALAGVQGRVTDASGVSGSLVNLGLRYAGEALMPQPFLSFSVARLAVPVAPLYGPSLLRGHATRNTHP